MENRGVTGDQALDTERVAVTGNNVSFRMITRREVASLGQRTLKALPVAKLGMARSPRFRAWWPERQPILLPRAWGRQAAEF